LEGVHSFVAELFLFENESNPAAPYWSVLCDMAANHPSPDVQAACVAKLRIRNHRRQTTSVSLLDSAAGSSIVAVRRRADESRSRTVHYSRLSPAVSNAQLMGFLSEAGTVLKVRRCADGSLTNHFGFAEYASSAEAQRLTARDRTRFAGCDLRLQAARSPILDVEPSDAADDGSKRCTFGL
jgi:hypothetical protein